MNIKTSFLTIAYKTSSDVYQKHPILCEEIKENYNFLGLNIKPITLFMDKCDETKYWKPSSYNSNAVKLGSVIAYCVVSM